MTTSARARARDAGAQPWLWDSPFGPGKTHIVPPHGQYFGASRAGQERGQHESRGQRDPFLRDGLKESGEFLRLHEPIARFLSKELNAWGGILPYTGPSPEPN